MNEKRNDNVYSAKMRAGKRRTYFFDILETKGGDYYLSITESTKRGNKPGYLKNKIFLYKEDFNRFTSMMNDAVNHVKTELIPDFDYEQYERRQEEWEQRKLAENGSPAPTEEHQPQELESDEDMAW